MVRGVVTATLFLSGAAPANSTARANVRALLTTR